MQDPVNDWSRQLEGGIGSGVVCGCVVFRGLYKQVK